MRNLLLVVSAALSLAACSGPAGPAGSAPVTPPPAAGAKIPEWKLGHFSSPDGLWGAVIDRTGPELKLKLDRTDQVVALFMEKQRDARLPSGHFFNGPAGKPQLFLSEDGLLSYIKPEALANLAYNLQRGHGLLPLRRDADASPLGPPTARGVAQPPPEKSPAEVYSEKLAARSVIARLPGFQPQDAGNLDKVEAALRQATPDMLVHVAPAYADQFRWAPASGLIGDTDHGEGSVLIQGHAADKWSPKAKGVARYGLRFDTACRFNSPCRVRQLSLEGWPPPLQANTVGVVWNVKGTFITLVTLDGGRYRVGQWWGELAAKGAPLLDGAPARASWPAPLQHETYDLSVIRLLAKGGAIPQAEADKVAALEDAYFRCKNEAWSKGVKEQEKVQASSLDANRKYGKLSGIAARYEKTADKRCAGTVTKYAQGLIQFIQARNKRRQALYAAVQGLIK